MTKPVTPQEMFDLWQKMVNPGAYPLQSLMFPVLDAKELDKKIAELETVEHWLKANLAMLQLTIKSLDFQKQLLQGGEAAKDALDRGKSAGEVPNPAMWAWNLMAEATQPAAAAPARPAGKSRAAPRKKRRKSA